VVTVLIQFLKPECVNLSLVCSLRCPTFTLFCFLGGGLTSKRGIFGKKGESTTMLCVAFDKQQDVSHSGGANGFIYHWQSNMLTGTVKGHQGPVFAMLAVEKVCSVVFLVCMCVCVCVCVRVCVCYSITVDNMPIPYIILCTRIHTSTHKALAAVYKHSYCHPLNQHWVPLNT